MYHILESEVYRSIIIYNPGDYKQPTWTGYRYVAILYPTPRRRLSSAEFLI